LIGVLVDQFGMDIAISTMAASYVLGMIILSLIRLDHHAG
jgi:hypothetical protein